MMNKKTYIRKDLKEFTPYEPGEVAGGIKLDANENPYDIDKKVKNETINWLTNQESFSVYPDTNADQLRGAIAKLYGINPKQVVCGVGSDQLIDCLIRGLIMPGDRVVYPVPSFSMYQSMITLNHGKGIGIDLEPDFSYPIEKMIKACEEYNAKLLILCTPNNPTGNSLPLEDIREIARRVKCPVMVDEAYGEFTKESAISLINEFENIIVLRTFSKAYGLAGLRIGYGIGSEKALYPIQVTKPPYNINTFTQIVAKKVIENPAIYKAHVKKINQDRKILSEALTAIGITVYPSDANFLLVDCGNMELDKVLKEKNIHIRKMTIREKQMYRISIGTKEQNELLLKSIEEAWQNEAKK